MVPKNWLIVRLLSVLMILVGAAFAQSSDVGGGSGGSGAPDGSYWSDGNGGVAHLDVTDDSNGGVWTTTTTAAGFSGAVDGTAGPDTPSGLATCRDSDPMTTPDGSQYKVKDGKLYKKGSDGRWRRMRRIPKPGGGSIRSVYDNPVHLTGGTSSPFDGVLLGTAGVVPLREGDVAPFDGWLVPGDEATSLPHH